MNQIDKSDVACAFGRAADTYDRAAKLQRYVANQLLEHISHHGQKEPASILDAGSGTGYVSQQLKKIGNKVTSLDISYSMLEYSKQKQTAHAYVQGDIEKLPFNDAQFDLSISNLALQWCNDFAQALQELYRVTKKGGQVLFSTIIDGSLYELDQAWRAVDNKKHTLNFISFEMLKNQCDRYQCRLIPLTQIQNFPSIVAVLRSLQQIGATTLPEKRGAGLRGRSILNTLSQAYPAEKGKFPLTYHIALGIINK